jgi:F-type H+-transporting ATPase subunit epsilon
MNVSIVAAEAEMWRGEAEMVLARSPEGEFGILRGHIPFLAALVPGVVTVVDGNSRRSWLVPGGFLEASGTMDDYHVIVLVDDAEETVDLSDDEVKRRLEEMRRAALEGAEKTEH